MPPLLQLLRPRQWSKSVFVAAPLFFAGRLSDPEAWWLTAIAMLCFALLSSAVYVFNDMRDRAEDALHPVKKFRPLASGAVAIPQAALLASMCLAAAFFLLLILPPECALLAVIYVLLNLSYTLVLKHIALLDVCVLAGCYVLRVLMGAAAIGAPASAWMIITTYLLALFLGLGKRYHEINIPSYAQHKPNLKSLSPALLDRLVVLSAGAALMAYAIYTVEMARTKGHEALVYTVAFVAFGLFRYLKALLVDGRGGEPEKAIMDDTAQLLNLAVWLATTIWILF